MNALLAAIEAHAADFGLVLARTMGVYAVAPIIGDQQVPTRIRVTAAALTAAVLTPVAEAHAQPIALTMPGYVRLLSHGVLCGLLLGYVASLFFAAVRFAGQLLDLQTGYNIAQIIDPSLGTRAAGLDKAHYLIGGLVFLGLDGHHWVLLGLGQSFQDVSWRSSLIGPGALNSVAALAGIVIRGGLRIAAPAVGALFLVDVILGLLARAMPQANMFIVGAPLRPLVGILTIGLAVSATVAVMVGVLGEIAPVLVELTSAP